MIIYYTRTQYLLSKEGFEKEFREMFEANTRAKEIMERYSISYHVYRNLLEAYGIRAQKPCRRKKTN